MPPLLSIVVPTHNRGKYAESCIEGVLAFDSADIQLVVTDTSTDDHLLTLLETSGSKPLRDPRLIYRRLRTPSNLTQNHNDAVALASGQYVCIIGDDDCITSAALEATRWASSNDVALVSQTQTSIYAWPDFRAKLSGAGHAARLYVPRRASNCRWRVAEDDLQLALRRACQGTEAMPRCYHGIVRRTLLDKVQQQTGAYFHGSSPDMSAAVAMACLIDQYCEVDLPLTISGISSGSNSGRSAMNTHKGNLANESQTESFKDAGWTPGVPRFFSVETVWAHAALETLIRMRPEAVTQFNYARLLALCTLRHPDFAEPTEQALREASAIAGRDLTRDVAAEKRGEHRRRLMHLLRRAIIPTAANGRRFFGNLPDVASASACYEAYARRKGLAFQPPDPLMTG